jgi:hypothetical protein
MPDEGVGIISPALAVLEGLSSAARIKVGEVGN